MANYVVSDTNLTAVANAIRTRGGTQQPLAFPNGFVSAINDIGPDLSQDTVTAGTMTLGTTAHNAQNQPITGTIVVQHYYTGSSAPSSSLGVDGDVYLQTEA